MNPKRFLIKIIKPYLIAGLFLLAMKTPDDPRHLIVPRSGFYRIVAEPVRVVILTGREQGATRDSRPFLEGGRW
jgi:hypothetical protein